MRTRDSSRLRASTPTALVLAFLLVMGSSSWSHVAGGVRTAPHASVPAEDGVLGEVAQAAAPSSGRGADEAHRTGTVLPEGAEEGGRPVAEPEREEVWATEQQRAAPGSRLPDCAHACGPCSPCRRVMVSFMCAQASESCPVAYRCLCRGRFFRVPSL